MPYRTFSADEVARHLHITRGDVDRLVRARDIPFEKRGARLVFRKVEIEAWASQRVLGLKGGELAEYHQKTSQDAARTLSRKAIMPDLICPNFINPALPAKTKSSALREMVCLAERTGRVPDPKTLLASLESREALCSTGLPGGVALLHPRQPDPDLFDAPLILLGRTVQEIPFGAPDGRPTRLFFLLGCADEVLHLHSLARLCLLAQKTALLDQLLLAPDAEAMCQSIISSEQAVLAGDPTG